MLWPIPVLPCGDLNDPLMVAIDDLIGVLFGVYS